MIIKETKMSYFSVQSIVLINNSRPSSFLGLFSYTTTLLSEYFQPVSLLEVSTSTPLHTHPAFSFSFNSFDKKLAHPNQDRRNLIHDEIWTAVPGRVRQDLMDIKPFIIGNAKGKYEKQTTLV